MTRCLKWENIVTQRIRSKSSHKDVTKQAVVFEIFLYFIYLLFALSQELAFLKNFRRAATIVCLERTELLSMDREDFFASGIDKTFARDLERRMDFLR